MLAAKRFLIFVVLLSLLAGSGAGCQPKFQPGSYTDDAGRVVSIDKIPQRIVSSVPSVTEMLFALGVEGKVVGVSDYSDYPEEAKLKPSVGSYFNPSIEKIVKLNPDLVLTSGSDKQL
ncbi:MAG: ABC transporter substrate-binding protein, partial [Chloroflexi bacterium]|nr:ABC transporter substrate-binding protein [Chloroflexota bacterium]